MTPHVTKHMAYRVRDRANENDPPGRITIRSIADNWCECGPDSVFPCDMVTCRKRAGRL